MGQDQSSPSRSRDPLTLSTSSSLTTQNKSTIQSNVFSQQQEDLENEIESEILEEEEGGDFGDNSNEGIIRVVDGPQCEEEDEELRLLRSIKKFDPFIKEQEKGFSLDNLLGLKQNTSTISSSLNNEQQLNVAVDMLFELQSHIKDQMKHVNNEQRILLRRITYVDELSNYSAKTISSAFNQAKIVSEKVSEVTILKEQASKSQEYAISIFKSLSALEKYLDPEDKIQITEDSSVKWPELSQLRSRALKISHPPFERLLKSSTTNDISTVGTSTSPLLEKVVVNGEPALPTHESTPKFSLKDNPMDQTGDSSTSTSSLALSRLRGISSRSIRKLYTGAEE
ncbi:unnamed protein product [Mucor hiemalis]